MKTIGRIIIILVAALVVVGVTMTVTNSSSSVQAAPNFQDGQPSQIGDGNFVPGQRPEGARDGGGSNSLFESIGHLLIIAAIMFVVVVIERFWGKIFKPRLARS